MSRPARTKPRSPSPSSAPPHWTTRVVVLAAPSLLLLMVGFRLFVSTGRDDAHITYWPAYTLSHFGEMLNYNGERVEQSSSLLHVLLLAILNKLTRIDVPTLGKLSSIFAGVGTLLMVYLLIRKAGDRAVAFAGSIMAAACAYFMYWSFGGLETTLVSLSGIVLIVANAGYLARAGSRIVGPVFAAIAFALVRPESPLVLVGLASIAVILGAWGRLGTEDPRAVRTRALKLLAAAVVIWMSIIAFRLAYFGSAFPQPVAAKYGGLSRDSLASGFQYLRTSVFGAGLGVAASLLAAGVACAYLSINEWRKQQHDPYLQLALAFVLIYLVFAIASGGDWMEGGRFFVFFIPIALALIPLAIARAITGARQRVAVVALICTVLVLFEAASLMSFSRDQSPGTLHWQALDIAKQHDVSAYSWFEKRNRVNIRDVPIIDFLDELIPDIEAIRPGPVIMMTAQMGMIPYHVTQEFRGRVLYIDRRGLCDRMLTDCEYSKALGRDARGLHMDYLEFFADQEKIYVQCNLPRPDVVFDLRGGNTHVVSENGYSIVARQFGEVRDALGLGGEVEATGFVAVKKELWVAIVVADSIRAAEGNSKQ